MLRARGLDYLGDPVAQALSRTGVISRMRRDFTEVPRHLATYTASQYAGGKVRWLVVDDDHNQSLSFTRKLY